MKKLFYLLFFFIVISNIIKAQGQVSDVSIPMKIPFIIVSADTINGTVNLSSIIKTGVSAAMTAGSVTVLCTSVTTTCAIILTGQATGGTAGFLRVSARTAGVSFVITSSNGADTETVGWILMEPN